MREPTVKATHRPVSRRTFVTGLGLASGALASLAACGGSSSAPVSAADPVARWLTHRPVYIAHRGGDGNWPECSAYAYRHAAAWNAQAALEAPVWATSDGVWVLSDTASTAAVFGVDHHIPSTSWKVLSRLRSTVGHQQMGRLIPDVLEPYASRHILFVDNKQGNDPTALFALLARHGGPRRIVMKSYWASRRMPVAAREAGYRTWGYYYARDMRHFAATQGRYDLLGLDYTAPSADFATMRATGKPVIAHIIADRRAANVAFRKGVTGLMVSGVTSVIPHTG